MQEIDILTMAQARAEYQQVRAARRALFARQVGLAQREARLKAALGVLA